MSRRRAPLSGQAPYTGSRLRRIVAALASAGRARSSADRLVAEGTRLLDDIGVLWCDLAYGNGQPD